MPSAIAVMPVIGRSRDARKRGWRDEGVQPRKGGMVEWEWGWMQMKEKAVTDSVEEEMKEGKKDGSKGEEPSRCPQHVCFLCCRFAQPGER